MLSRAEALGEVTMFVEELTNDPEVGDLAVTVDLSTGVVTAEFVLDIDPDDDTPAATITLAVLETE